MPAVTSQIHTSAEWSSLPLSQQTATQRFWRDYHHTVDNALFHQGKGTKYYSPNVIYHNTNNVTYYGGDQMWTWMQSMFGQFGDLKHEIQSWSEINEEKEDSKERLVYMQFLRKVWKNGRKESDGAPDVTVPVFWMCRIGSAEGGGDGEGGEGGFEGLQFKECWIYYDTLLFAPIMPKEATVFKAVNVVEEKGGK